MKHGPVAQPIVLALGELEQPEFQQAAELLRASTTLVAVADVDEALAWLSDMDASDDSVPLELMVVAQSWPDEFTAGDIDRLRRAAPLVRILSLAGTWCEGEPRTGHPWPADFRASWNQWPARFDQELARWRTGLCPAWGSPITTTDDERLIERVPPESTARRGLVAIASRSSDMSQCLTQACVALGHAAVSLDPALRRRVTGIDAAIWDGAGCGPREADELQGFVKALDGAGVVTLLDFPRVEDCRRARSAGAAAVLSKPLLLADLARVLDDALGRNNP